MTLAASIVENMPLLAVSHSISWKIIILMISASLTRSQVCGIDTGAGVIIFSTSNIKGALHANGVGLSRTLRHVLNNE